MTEQERIELLRRVAACAPKEMRAEVVLNTGDEPFFAHFEGIPRGASNREDEGVWLYLDDDMDDAEAIIAMLDAMEGAGWVSFQFTSEYGDRILSGWKLHRDTEEYRSWRGDGMARSIPVARAFCAVFEAEGEK